MSLSLFLSPLQALESCNEVSLQPFFSRLNPSCLSLFSWKRGSSSFAHAHLNIHQKKPKDFLQRVALNEFSLFHVWDCPDRGAALTLEFPDALIHDFYPATSLGINLESLLNVRGRKISPFSFYIKCQRCLDFKEAVTLFGKKVKKDLPLADWKTLLQ